MQRALWFGSSTGLDTTFDPARVPYDPEVGVTPAKIAVNVDISKTGRVSRRKGWENTVITDACHSLFCDGGDAFFVTGDALKMLAPDMSVTNLRNITVNAPVGFEQIGSRTFYTNGRENGFILNGKSYGWNQAVPNQKDSTIIYSPPPVGTLLGYYKGRIYVAQQHIVWYSEANNLNTFNLKKYLAFSSSVTMFKGVSNGVWLGTENQILFLRGDSPDNLEQQRKALTGVIPGSDTYVDCTSIPGLADEYGQQVNGVGVLFCTPKGIYIGTESGKLMQLSKGKLTIPKSLMGAGVCIGNRYIASLGDSLYTNRLAICQQVITPAISQYKNYSFNSFAVIGENTYGANTNGIFKLDMADNDVSSTTSIAVIEAHYESVLTDFGIKAEKRVRKCNGTLEANGELRFSFKSNEAHEIVQHTVPASTDNQQHSVEIPVGRSIKGRFYNFTIQNINGADFSVDNLEAFIDVLSRKPEKRGSN
jgi:hypothetical protein